MKYINYIFLGLLLLGAFTLKDSLTFSTNLLSLFAPKDSVEKLRIATELGYTKELLIAVKGFNTASQEKTHTIVKELKKLDSIKNIKYMLSPSKDVQNYYNDNYFLLSDFDAGIQTTSLIQSKLDAIKQKRAENFFYQPIDKRDPLQLFSMPSNTLNISSQNDLMSLNDYGYFIHTQTNVTPSQMSEARKLYKEIKNITSRHNNVIAYAGFFHTVENSSKIKDDVIFLSIVSIIMLLVLYIVLLKNVKILFHTVMALLSSSLFASIVVLSLFENFHIISLAFGITITAVSIDYLFHYYFHGFYQKRQRIDKNVLYGFLTTLSAFCIFSFIPVTLISQISIFTVLSLSCSYFLFTFVFKYLEIMPHKLENLEVKSYALFPASIVLLFSLILLGYSFLTSSLDKNIQNLDYNNKELNKVRTIFTSESDSKLLPVLISADTPEDIIENLHTIKKTQEDTFSLASFMNTNKECQKRRDILNNYDFNTLRNTFLEEAKKLGLRETYFDKTYLFTSDSFLCKNNSFAPFSSYNLHITQSESVFYTLAFVRDPLKITKYPFVDRIDVKSIFAEVSTNMYKDIYKFALGVFLVILILLFFSVRGKFFYGLTYILFPLSITLSIVVTFFALNIMHIFAFIILIAISIDYGIYMSNTKKATQTIVAIKYSLLSTFGAFGVLILSSITALYSIGLVISLGVLSIFFLMKVLK